VKAVSVRQTPGPETSQLFCPSIPTSIGVRKDIENALEDGLFREIDGKFGPGPSGPTPIVVRASLLKIYDGYD
jgi:hypothetical protein